MTNQSVHRASASSPRSSTTRPRGSAILMAVALLMLLAVLGTAFISATRSDRGASVLHASEMQNDLILQAAYNLVEAAVLGDIFDASGAGSTFRPASDATNHHEYAHWDCPVAADGTTGADAWLAERVPVRRDASDGSGEQIAWPAISAPLLAPFKFQDPTRPEVIGSYDRRRSVTPGHVEIGGRRRPAFIIDGQPYLAADSDGDGIADAGLFPLNISRGGVSYFAAVRIVDNAAAVNAAVAWRESGAIGRNFYPTNVDLPRILTPPDPASPALAQWRQGGGKESVLLAAARPSASASALPASMWADTVRGRQMLPASDMLAVARDPLGMRFDADGVIESLLPASLRTVRRASPYAADEVEAWFAQNFDYAAEGFSRRPLLVTTNAVSSAIAAHALPERLKNLFASPYPISPGKTNINSAPFELLWRTYWNIMSDGGAEKTPFVQELPPKAPPPAGQQPPQTGEFNYNPYVAEHPQRMFRSPLRDYRYTDAQSFDRRTVRLPPFEVLLLRSALAAINTIDLRDDDERVSARRLQLQAMIDGSPRNVDVTIFGNERQPFITEVFVHTDTVTAGPGGKANPCGYIAVELFNPYDQSIDMSRWQLAIVDRTATQGARPGKRLRVIHHFAGTSIAPRGRLVLENLDADATAVKSAKYRPRVSGLDPLPAGVATCAVPNLHEALTIDSVRGGELVLLRPAIEQTRTADGAAKVFRHNAPVDQFDFTGMSLGDEGPDGYVTWHYARDDSLDWRFVHPGRYDGARTVARNEGTKKEVYSYAMPAPTRAIATLGRANSGATYDHRFPGIQLHTLQGNTAGGSQPIGPFARAGDVMHATFIGAYQIDGAGAGEVLELNAITTDAAFADDADPVDDAEENIGRFAPIPAIESAAGGGSTSGGGPLRRLPPTSWRPGLNGDGHGRPYQLENFLITDVVDRDALQIQAVKGKTGTWYAPSQIALRNFEIGSTIYTGKLNPDGSKMHIDHCQITLGRGLPRMTTDVLIEDGYIHTGNTDPLLIQDGNFGTITLKNVRIGDGRQTVKLTIEKGGIIDRIIIENCPGIRIAITGNPDFSANGGNIGVVEVRNSPGAQIMPQKMNNGVRTRYRLIEDEGTPPPATSTTRVDDYGTDATAWRYRWAMDLFEHITVLPGAAELGGAQTPPGGFPAAPVEGLVNINSAPWPVLAAVPMVPDPADNAELAKAIVQYRPFENLFELNRVLSFEQPEKGFQNGWGTLRFSSDFGDAEGDLTPGDGVTGDFEQKFIMLNRISNLVTTRSDSFTCYLTVQGWRNAGQEGGEAELVLERREVFILDRSDVTPLNRKLKVMSARMP